MTINNIHVTIKLQIREREREKKMYVVVENKDTEIEKDILQYETYGDAMRACAMLTSQQDVLDQIFGDNRLTATDFFEVIEK